MGWVVLHGPIAVRSLADIGRRDGVRRVLFFALVVQAERGERNVPDCHGGVRAASLPFFPCCAIYAGAAR